MRKTIVFIVFLLHSFSTHAIEVVFRYDDFLLSPDSLQERLLEVFNEQKIPITLAVIPCREDTFYFEDGSYMSLLRKMESEGIVEIALHGISHRDLGDYNGEFGGLPLQNQIQMISKGKQFLDSLFFPTITFIPPFNLYDENTLSALEELEFKCISSGMHIGPPLTSKKLQYYPETIDHPNQLLKAIEDNRNRNNGIIILMFHAYDFNQSFSMEDLNSLLWKISNMKDVECVTFRTLCERNVKSDEIRVNANIEINLLSKLLKTGQMLQTTSYAIVIRICNLLIYFLIVLCSMLLGRYGFGIRNKEFMISEGLIMAFVGVAVWWHLLTPLKCILLALLLPLGCAIVCLLIQNKKRPADT